MKEISAIIGSHIRALRLERRWTQEQLAEKADLHPTYINVLENGKKNASIDVVYRLANAFELSLSEFFQGIPDLDQRPIRDVDGFLIPSIDLLTDSTTNRSRPRYAQEDHIEALVRDFTQKLIRELRTDNVSEDKK